MNRRTISIFGAVLSCALAGSSGASAQTFQAYRCGDGSQFIVGFFQYDRRAHLQIDGRSVGTIGPGHRYDGWLPAGRHVLTVRTASYVGLPQPTSITVNVRPGRTDVFTALWDSNLIFLVPAGAWLTPGKQWELKPH